MTRQIRAHYDQETITLYQAYSAPIATAATTTQILSSSPLFNPNRMTWIKPSWCWMMYRSNYSYKDARQSHILALKMKHTHFHALLAEAQLAYHGSARETGAKVLVQWDPERGHDLEKLDYRSIQIGISGGMVEKWVGEWIVRIEDVTDRARGLKKFLEESKEKGEEVDWEELKGLGLLPEERIYDVPEEIALRLEMKGEVRGEERGS